MFLLRQFLCFYVFKSWGIRSAKPWNKGPCGWALPGGAQTSWGSSEFSGETKSPEVVDLPTWTPVDEKHWILREDLKSTSGGRGCCWRGLELWMKTVLTWDKEKDVRVELSSQIETRRFPPRGLRIFSEDLVSCQVCQVKRKSFGLVRVPRDLRQCSLLDVLRPCATQRAAIFSPNAGILSMHDHVSVESFELFPQQAVYRRQRSLVLLLCVRYPWLCFWKASW